MLKSRLLRDVERQQISDDVLAEFATLLIAALEIPEVAQAVGLIAARSAADARSAARLTQSTAVRGTNRTRGGGRGQ